MNWQTSICHRHYTNWPPQWPEKHTTIVTTSHTTANTQTRANHRPEQTNSKNTQPTLAPTISTQDPNHYLQTPNTTMCSNNNNSNFQRHNTTSPNTTHLILITPVYRNHLPTSTIVTDVTPFNHILVSHTFFIRHNSSYWHNHSSIWTIFTTTLSSSHNTVHIRLNKFQIHLTHPWTDLQLPFCLVLGTECIELAQMKSQNTPTTHIFPITRCPISPNHPINIISHPKPGGESGEW